MTKFGGLFGLSCLFLLAGCSWLLDAVANPDAPTFPLEVKAAAGEHALAWSASGLPLEKPADKTSLGTERDWEMLYGYYVFAAADNPYTGYVLVGRLVNPEVLARTWMNSTWNGSSLVDTRVEVVPSGEPAARDLATNFRIADNYGYRYSDRGC